MEKTCKLCRRSLPANLENFHAHNKAKDGLNIYCKECARRKTKDWSANNKDRKAAADKSYADENRKKISEYQKQYRLKNSEKMKAYSEEYRTRNAGSLREKKKEYFSREEIRERRRAYLRERKVKDPAFKLICNVRSAISEALKGVEGALRHLPYSASDLRKHVERQFAKDMNWENYGTVWHLDHIRPVSSFYIDGPDCEDFKACWALSNLRPLCAHENMSKQGKITHLI